MFELQLLRRLPRLGNVMVHGDLYAQGGEHQHRVGPHSHDLPMHSHE
jgi:hypothetical protein